MEWISLIELSDAYLHFSTYPTSESSYRSPRSLRFFGCSLSPLWPGDSPQVFTMMVKEMKIMTLSRRIRLHQAHSRVAKCDGQLTQGNSDPIKRMISAPSSAQAALSKVVNFLYIPIHSSEPQSSSIRIHRSRPTSIQNRCSDH